MGYICILNIEGLYYGFILLYLCMCYITVSHSGLIKVFLILIPKIKEQS